MFALKSGRGRQGGATNGRGGRAASADGLVLPRWLRRPVRLASRLVDDDFELPPFTTTALTAALFAAAGLYGTIAGGHVDSVVQAMTSRSGFAIGDVRISGNRETSDIDVLQAVGLDGWTSLVGFSAAAARDRVDALPWVESASVRKVYPSALDIDIVERKPFAIWQHGSQLTVVERNGEVIARYSGGQQAALPLIIGMGAREAAPAFVSKVQRHAILAWRVRAYIRVGDRRWDLRFDNGTTIKLPERDEGAALDTLARLERERGLLSRDITVVDMRIANRLAVRLTPDAVESRAAALEERLSKRPEARI